MKKIVPTAIIALSFGLALGYMSSNNKTPTQTELSNNTVKNDSCFINNNKASNVELFKSAGKTWQLSDLPAKDQLTYVLNYSKSYRANIAFTKELTRRLYLAQKSGKKLIDGNIPSLNTLLSERIKISDETVKKFYEDNRSGFPKTLTYKQIAPNLRNHLFKQKKTKLLADIDKEMNSQSDVAISITRPCPPALSLGKDGLMISIGKENTSLKMSYFSDFFCPNCRVDWQKMNYILKENLDHMSFTLIPKVGNGNTTSTYIAKSLFCTAKQSKDRYLKALKIAFTTPINYKNDLKSVKKYLNKNIRINLQVDSKSYDTCMENKETQTYIDEITQLSSTMNILSSPIAFFNGKLFFQAKSGTSEIKSLIKSMR